MELTRRSKRDTAKRPATSELLAKIKENSKVLVGASVGFAVLVGAGIALPAFGTNGLDSNKDVSQWIHFDTIKAVDGFSAPTPRTDYGSPALATKQSVGTITKNDGKCSFNGQISYLPSYNEGRGDKYLTENHLYTLAEGNGVVVSELDKVKLRASSGKFEALQTSYSYEMSTVDSVTEKEQTVEKYRIVAVRAFDTLVDMKSAETPSEGQYGSDPKKGLPLVTLSYECDTEESFSESDWKNMVNSVTVDLNAKNEPEFDVVDNGEAEGLPERGVEPVIEDADATIVPDRENATEESYEVPTDQQTSGPMEFVQEEVTDATPEGEEPVETIPEVEEPTSE